MLPRTSLLLLTLCLCTSAVYADPTFVVTDFTSGTEGWQPDNPWFTSSDNGTEPDNPYLAMDVGAMGAGRGSRLITFNAEPDWTGDYFAAGVSGIELDVVNRSETDTVYLRVAIGNQSNPQQSGGTWWLSDTFAELSPGTDWTHVRLSLLEEDLRTVGNLSGELGTDSYESTFSDVRVIRLLSAVIPLGAIGDEFVGLVGFDNIQLVPEPSTGALLALGIVAIGSAARRRRLTVHARSPTPNLG